MTTLVTGGAGFIGSHLIENLLDDGENVIVLDDLSTGTMENLETVKYRPGFTFVEGSILDRPLLGELTSRADTVYHLAAAVGTFTILDKTLTSLRTNLHGTENVVDAALQAGAKVLVASTSEVYGKNTTVGLREDDDRIIGSPLKSRWSYAEAKAIDETLAYVYHAELGLKTVIVRLFNTVGPRQTGMYGMVIPRFVRQALAGEPVTVYGTGEQVRCFCHVADVIPTLRKLMADPDAEGRVFNVGSSSQVSIGQLAARVIELTGSNSVITHIPYEDAYPSGFEDMERRVPDCSRAAAQVGHVASRDLDTIIRDVAAYQQLQAMQAIPASLA